MIQMRNKIRNWLFHNPQINPYVISQVGVYRLLSSFNRVLPNFLIIGAAKCGTTSLYDYLVQHPDIIPSSMKEVNYFNTRYCGRLWYQANFPRKNEMKNGTQITGEATPVYLPHPLIPKRVFTLIPKVKLIIILRNPIDRAYSHYQDKVRSGIEKLTFEDSIKNRKKKLEKDFLKLSSIEDYDSRYYERFGYLEQGKYEEHIKRWFEFFPRKQFLFLKTEDLNYNSQETVDSVFEFLGVCSKEIKDFSRKNTGSYQEMKLETRNNLIEFFRPHNEKLLKLLKMNFDWDK